MRLGKKLLPWLLPLAVIGLLGLGIWLASRPSSDRVLRLADGREFALEQITYGTNHVYRTGNALARLVAPLLPAKLKQRSGVTEHYQQTSLPSLILWGTWSGLAGQNNYISTPAVLVDSSGKETELVWPFLVASPKTGVRQVGWKFFNYPRREQELRFRVYQQKIESVPELAGEMRLSNPHSGPYPQWKPEPCPQAKTNGPWECTLVAFAPSAVKRHHNSVWQEVGQGYAALFQVRENGQSAPQWSPEFVDVSDAMGNTLQPAYRSTEIVADFKQMRFSGPLWPSESAWKLKFGFVRSGPFASNEVVSLENIPAHTGQRTVQFGTNLMIQGARILEVALKPYYPLSGPPRKIWPNAQIVLTGSGPSSGWYLSLVTLKDQENKPLFFEKGTFNGSAWQFPFKMPDGTRSLSFQVAAQSIRNVEFTASLGPAPPR